MTFNSILQSLIDSSETNQQILDDLITGRQAVSIESDDSGTPAPTVDSNEVWTITQDTADSNGIYAGVYTFALDTACSVLTISSVTGHTTPANTAFPAARYTDCADVVHDLTSVMDLSGKAVKRFEIYSDTAFTVELTVEATWEYMILNGNPLPTGTVIVYGTPVNDDYIEGTSQNGFASAHVEVNFIDPVNVTYLEHFWTVNQANSTYGVNMNLYLNNVEVDNSLQLPSSSMSGSTVWVGDLMVDKILFKSNGPLTCRLNKIVITGKGNVPIWG